MNTAKKMFVFGVIAFIAISVVSFKATIPFNTDGEVETFIGWVFRLIAALAASAISISIPGMLEIRHAKNDSGNMTLLKNETTNEPESTNLVEKEPTITASGAIAVFILVYLFNPIG